MGTLWNPLGYHLWEKGSPRKLHFCSMWSHWYLLSLTFHRHVLHNHCIHGIYCIHIPQGFSPVWFLWWTMNCDLLEKAFPHSLCSWGFSPVWVLLMFSELNLHECFPTCAASVGLLSSFSCLMSNELCLPGECLPRECLPGEWLPALTACLWLLSWISFLMATERWFSATGFHTTIVSDCTKSFIILEAGRWFPIPTEPIRILSWVSSIPKN